MPTDEQDPFGEYAPETQTAGTLPVRETPAPNEDEQDPFGEYAPETQTAGTLPVRVESGKYGIDKPRRPETQTAGMPPVREAPAPDEVESAKYGIGKPRRIIVRGTIAADKGPDDKRE